MTAPSVTRSPLVEIPRPGLRLPGRIALALLFVLGLGALVGGIALAARPDGSIMHFNVAILAGSPFADFLVPGLILGGLFGIGSLAVAALGLRQERLAPFLAFAIGCGHMAWIVVQVSIIREVNPLHPAFFLVGLGIAAASIPWGWPVFQAWWARH